VLAFRRDGRALLWGGLDGAVKSWSVEPERAAWRATPHRGRVLQVSVAPGRPDLLVVNDLKQALIWDVKGRSCRRVPGAWSSGAFLDDKRPGLERLAVDDHDLTGEPLGSWSSTARRSSPGRRSSPSSPR